MKLFQKEFFNEKCLTLMLKHPIFQLKLSNYPLIVKTDK